MMSYEEFLTRVIDEGIAAVREDYKGRKPHWTEAAVAGFEACRGKSLNELEALLYRARSLSAKARAYHTDINRYWRIQCFGAEVEWVCNVVSAALVGMGHHGIMTPTARGFIQAGKIIPPDVQPHGFVKP